MRHISLAGLCLTMVACGAPPSESTSSAAVSGTYTLYSGGTIYTGLEAASARTVEAVLVDPEGRIEATGDLGTLDARYPASTREIDLAGGVMFPGFVDGHAHLLGIGQREMTLDVSQATSLGNLVERLAAVTKDAPSGQVISGRGWIETDWPEGRMPTALDLDPVSEDNPVILVRADGHALVANSAAMRAAGIDETTPDPEGGRIERDETGVATGIFIDNAMAALRTLIDTPKRAERETALAIGAELYASRGWTGLHNMSVDPADAPLMAALDGEGRLPVRVHNAFDESGFDLAATRQYETDTIQNRAVKIYMDGALGSRGALLFEPYSDRPETSGLALRTEGETHGLLQRALDRDVQIAFHAIGDKANAYALAWMDMALQASDTPGAARWRIEHAQVLRTDDIARFAGTGILASMQPSHAIGDLKFAPARLGLDRLTGAYAWQSVLAAGGVVVAGSDAPVEVGSPIIEFYAAVARTALDGTRGKGWHPEEALTRMQALHSLTAAPAYASFQEAELGTIEVGKWADFTVFDQDLMRVSVDDILQTEAVMTVVAGEIVWRAQ